MKNIFWVFVIQGVTRGMVYQFKLQTVLDHRQFLEDNLKKELVEIRQQRSAAENVLNQLKRKAEETIVRLQEEQAKGLSSDHVVGYHHYMHRLSDHTVAQRKVLAALDAQVARKQEAVLEAMKNRQILEKLKAQGFERYTQDMLRKEMNFIDEIAVNQYARKQMNGNGEDQE